MISNAKKYVVKLYIRGSVGRPPYNSTVTVYAYNDEEAAEKAIKHEMRGTFQDVGYASFKVESVTVEY